CDSRSRNRRRESRQSRSCPTWGMRCSDLELPPFGPSSAVTESGSSGRFLLLFRTVVTRPRDTVEFRTTEECLLSGLVRLGLAAPCAQCFLLKRAPVGERELPRRRPHLIHQIQVLRRLRGALAARKEGDSRHGTRHVALERAHGRFGHLLRIRA